MKVHVATDHAGFALKEAAKLWIRGLGYEVVDHGAYTLVETDDYPDFIKLAAQAVSDDPENSRGIIFGGSGQGEDMVADKFEHVRSAVYYGGPIEVVKLSREHNDANMLAIGARFVTGEEARKAIEVWLSTRFSGDERHVRRIQKLNEL